MAERATIKGTNRTHVGSNCNVGPIRKLPEAEKAIPVFDELPVLGIGRGVCSMRFVTGVCCCCHKFLLMLGVTP
jgi:hypothetical protein